MNTETPPATNASERDCLESVSGQEYRRVCHELMEEKQFTENLGRRLDQSQRELAEAREKIATLDKQVRQLDQFGSAWQAEEAEQSAADGSGVGK